MLARLSLIGILIVLASCSSMVGSFLKDPEVKVVDVSIKDISTQDISLDLKLNVNNPNPSGFKLGKIRYGLNLSGDKVTEGVFDKGVEVPAHGSAEVIVPLNFKYKSLENLVNHLLKKNLTKDYELNGSVDLGIISIPFSKKGELQLGR